MEKSDLAPIYREYLLDFMKNSYDDMIETRILSFDEFKEELKKDKKIEL